METRWLARVAHECLQHWLLCSGWRTWLTKGSFEEATQRRSEACDTYLSEFFFVLFMRAQKDVAIVPSHSGMASKSCQYLSSPSICRQYIFCSVCPFDEYWVHHIFSRVSQFASANRTSFRNSESPFILMHFTYLYLPPLKCVPDSSDDYILPITLDIYDWAFRCLF